MFSSPGRTPTARRRHDVPASSRASTPAAGVTRVGAQTTSRVNAGKARQSYRPSYGGGGALTAASETSSLIGTRRKERRRSIEATDSSLEPGTVLSRDDNHAISILSRLPVEVATALNATTSYDATQSALDVEVGFAHLVLHGRCYVWSFLVRAADSPTCFVYDLAALFPSSRQTSSSFASAETLPHCAFVPKGAEREPGILLISHSGTVRYSESVSNVLASSNRSIELGLGSGESVTQIQRCSNNVYVVGTSYARLIGVRLVASGGHLQPVVAVFAQPRGIFGRFFGAAANITIGAQGLAALVSNKQPGSVDLGSDLYAVSQQAIQKWNVSEGRAERIVYETEIAQLIRLRDDRISEGSHASESLKILDCSLTASGPLILLYGFAYAQGGVQHYGLASLEEDASGSSAKLTTISHLAYSCASDSRPYSQPRLSVPRGGSVLFIVYPEAVVFRLVDGDGGLEESVELRDVASNRFIGHGFTSTSSKPAASEIAHMPLVTRRSGLLVVEVDVDAASQISRLIASGEDRAVVDTHRLKSKLERGVFHADNLLNPISFDLPLEIRGDLMAAAEQLSDDILNSESPSLIDTLDTRLQLSNRLERLRALASYLSLNGMLSTMTQNSLRRLCADAQLLAAGCELWDYINELLGDSSRLGQAGNILEDVVDRVMEHEAVQSEDVLRDFFRDYLKHLNQVLERVQAIASASSSEGIAKHSAVVTETNRILLTVFQAAHRYRSESAELYQLDVDKIGYEAWTCTAGNVHSLQTATTLTSSLIRERTRHLGALIDKEPRGNADEGQDAKKEHERYTQLMLKGQLCELTGQLINIYEERLSYLSRAGAGNSALQREYVAICVKFAAERRAALLSLVHVGRTDRALYLAEQHRDFASLTELCSGPTSSAEQRPHRLRHYLNKYGEPFAVALYTFYVQTGQMHTLLTQDAAFYPLLQRFLDRDASLNRVAWLHDLAVGDERRAGSRLLAEADQERGSTGSKRLMLSLAKLCRVSQLDEIQIATQSEQGAIEAIDDQLDLINVHDRIIDTLLTGRNDEDDETAMDDDEEEAGSEAGVLRAQQLVDSLSQNKPASASLFLVLAKQLLARRSLLSDDLIDLLTLHDASPTSQADFALSLEVFVRSRDMPAARAQYVLSSLWRRTLTFDDWNTITQTKGMSDEAINVRLRQTALYHLIASASGNESTSEAIRGVEEMLLPPSQDALEARLSIIRANVSDEQQLDEIPEVVDLQRESESEITSLQTLLREREMARWYTQVRRLVEEDLNGGQEEHTMDASREIELAGMQSIDEANSVEMV